MAQEPETQTLALSCTFDDARNVGHYKRLAVAIAHDA